MNNRKKKLQDIQIGEAVILNLPCLVRITKIEPSPGTPYRGNNRVGYTDIQAIHASGESYIGSLVELNVVTPHDTG